VDRASPADLMQLATDVGPAPMHVGAVLILGTERGFSVQQAQQLLGERVHAVPRLRPRLRRAPPSCGWPFWADDPALTCGTTSCSGLASPGDERALLEVAATVTGEPLPRSRALWSATFTTGLAGGSGTGLIIVMSHVLADGIGGLAVWPDL
jgi:diacylglycerol O-acyltransferase / wax synthase